MHSKYLISCPLISVSKPPIMLDIAFSSDRVDIIEMRRLFSSKYTKRTAPRRKNVTGVLPHALKRMVDYVSADRSLNSIISG